MEARRRRAVQRRRLAVAGAAGLAFLVGAVVGGDDPPKAQRTVASPTPSPAAAESREVAAPRAATEEAQVPLSRQVGRVIVLRFHGTSVPAYVRRALRTGRASGAILFHDNVASPGQLRSLTRTLRRAGGPGTLVAVDQEGGPIRIVRWAPPADAAPAQGAAAGAEAHAGATALRGLGINVSLAPVADVPSVPGSVIAGRALGTTAPAASRAVVAAVRGWRAGRVAPAVKHFPGLGGARVNTDDGSVSIRRSRGALEQDLAPFRAAVRAGVPLVMVSHAVYPALDADRIASQSRAIATDLLRGRLHFRGVAITDSLEADAARATGEVDRAAEASLRAGVDLLLTTGQGSAIRVHRRLLAVARRDARMRARLQEAGARIERLRHQVA
jgi:beta-N-acetylhexosaminidase